jgi:hypothetical protein
LNDVALGDEIPKLLGDLRLLHVPSPPLEGPDTVTGSKTCVRGACQLPTDG